MVANRGFERVVSSCMAVRRRQCDVPQAGYPEFVAIVLIERDALTTEVFITEIAVALAPTNLRHGNGGKAVVRLERAAVAACTVTLVLGI